MSVDGSIQRIGLTTLAWRRVALSVILLGTAALNAWQLDREGYLRTRNSRRIGICRPSTR
jgi:hypothetical protein